MENARSMDNMRNTLVPERRRPIDLASKFRPFRECGSDLIRKLEACSQPHFPCGEGSVRASMYLPMIEKVLRRL